MKIVDLTPGHHNIYFNCLSDWSEEMVEAGDHKACWYDKYKDKGLRVKLAVDEEGTVGGMIQYLPIEAGIQDFLSLVYYCLLEGFISCVIKKNGGHRV